MAVRPVFVPKPNKHPAVQEVDIEFEWHSGFALAQAQRSIRSLHQAANDSGIKPLLEVSTKSADPTGVALSAFNLEIEHDMVRIPVECAYQGSKVFSKGGPYTELYGLAPRDAKSYPGLLRSGDLIAFKFYQVDFPLKPETAFYDWLYLRAIVDHPHLGSAVLDYSGFTDIHFNPARSLNCQARSIALYCALVRSNIDVRSLVADPQAYLAFVSGDSSDTIVVPTEAQMKDESSAPDWEQMSFLGIETKKRSRKTKAR